MFALGWELTSFARLQVCQFLVSWSMRDVTEGGNTDQTVLRLINKHLKFFYAPSQQRHIVRILFMVPVYAVTSFLSYFYCAFLPSFSVEIDS